MDHQKRKIKECIEVDPEGKDAEASIIWMHGLGANGNDFISLVESLSLPDNHKIRFIFPTAPQRPISINGGMVMPAWYDIKSLDDLDSRNQDEIGVKNSNEEIKSLINKEIKRGIDSSRIILGGFSQGGAIALYTGLRFEIKLGGIISLSAYCLQEKKLLQERSELNKNIPIFIAHGTFDDIVPFVLGKRMETVLLDADYQVKFKKYPMDHSVSLEEIEDISNFLKEILNLNH